MIIDTSIIIHIALEEDYSEKSVEVLANFANLRISTVSIVEAYAVLKSRNIVEPSILDELVKTLAIEILDFNSEQMNLARKAFEFYGKGQNNKAKLNFGDCLVYGLAKSRNEVLAFVGNDFNHTDLEVVRFPIEKNYF